MMKHDQWHKITRQIVFNVQFLWQEIPRKNAENMSRIYVIKDILNSNKTPFDLKKQCIGFSYSISLYL